MRLAVLVGALCWRARGLVVSKAAARARRRSATRLRERNYYEDLGVPSGSSAEMIKKAFRSAAKTLHPDQIMGTGGLARRAVASDVAGRVETVRALLDELEGGAMRDGLEEALVREAAAIADAGDARRAEKIAADRVRDEAAKRWQIIVDAHGVLSDQERKAAVDRKASAEALGDAIGTVGGMAFMGLGKVAEFGLDAVFGTGDKGNSTSSLSDADAAAKNATAVSAEAEGT